MTTTWTTDDLFEQIRQTLNEHFGIAPDAMTGATTVRELGLDSLQILDIMLQMEDRLGVKMQDLSVPPNPMLDDVVAVIERNLAGA